MSRRPPNPAAERAAKNQQTIKSLLKLECNKTCADCKRNKHPRWASWNLGVFICIRCSGIHRGMGTHISRVKSVDLDSWTDEQLQSVLRWGNARANKYWEAKLAPGHIPSEAKIENFIRTKYESKRWVMEGPMPDPSTLDADGDEDVPLNIVQQKAKLERSASQRASSVSSNPAQRRQQNVDLFGDSTPSPPIRPSTTDIPGARHPPPKAAPATPKQTKPGDSLLGLDFFGNSASSSNGRSANVASGSAGLPGPSRPDLKQSILSLYASVPKKPAPESQHGQTPSFGGIQSAAPPKPQSSFGGLDDAFSSLSFSSPMSTATQTRQTPTSSISKPAAQITSPPTLSGTGFFDPAPKSAPLPTHVSARSSSISQGWGGGFGDFQSPPATTTQTAPKPAPQPVPAPPSASNGLFDLNGPAPAPAPAPAPKAAPPPSSNINSVFNLSTPAPQPSKPSTSTPQVLSGWSNSDAWGSNEAWGSPDPAPAPPPKPIPSTVSAAPAPAATFTSDFGGWGDMTSSTKPAPQVTADEDFGGWSSAAPEVPAASSAAGGTKPAGGFGGSEDLFSNVWE
ncbi:MAG: hypothetical protein M1834_008951 [Cirrosporium novae-zelandiae]|nr:MAG: hypothetical protein M1834_008951 [Cirrosporium novae-zelandiae]